MVQCSLHEVETLFIAERALKTKGPESSCLVTEIYQVIDVIVITFYKMGLIFFDVKYVQLFYYMHAERH